MFRKLLTFDEAQKTIQHQFKPKPLGVEEILLLQSYNRVLAQNVKASMNVPPFDRSTVDGYALRAEDTFGAEENVPKSLKVCGAISIGEPTEVVIERSEAAEIVTGAPMPKGANAVVMVEHAQRQEDEVLVFDAVAEEENVLKAGADIRKGTTVLKSGQLLGSREIGVLAALGKTKAKVYTVPRVAVLSTGPEVTEPGGKLALGKIFDINAYSLSAGVVESGGKPAYLGVCPDDFVRLQKAVKDGLTRSDMMVTSGGVSIGPKDVMPKVLDSIGQPGVVVCGIAMKPGKPTTVASIGQKAVFALPGHPTSALLVFHLLAHPIIQAMAGRSKKPGLEVRAFAGMRLFPAKGRRTFVMVRLKRDISNRLVAQPIPESASGAITTLTRADGFVDVAENLQFIDAEEEVVVHVFRGSEESWF